jgi:uncharacterized glyoxalase superfamily protein PhnB
MSNSQSNKEHPPQESNTSSSGLPNNRSMPEPVVIPELAYPDAGQAAAWLCDVFGFQERLRIGNHRAQLSYKQGAVIVTELPGSQPGPAQAAPESSSTRQITHSIMVRVEDVDHHYHQALQNGARILHPPTDYPYGERQYTAEDPGGHIWTFSQSIADVDPTSWGGELLIS